MSCPTSTQLRLWLAGRLSEAESETIEAHVEKCAAVCQRTLEEMSGFEEEPDDSAPQRSRSGDSVLVEARGSGAVEAEGRDEPTLPLPSSAPPPIPAPLPGPTQVASPGTSADVPAAAVAPEIATIGHYQLLEVLGTGAMGTVYKALHSKLQKVVALKLLPADRMRQPEAVARFEREIRAVGRLQHPNIVAAHDAGEAGGVHYLVMELVDGMDLANLAERRGPLPVAVACEIVRQAALGLQHAHDNGLIHRDVKPSNMMLSLPRSGHRASVKILDLGLALLEEPRAEAADELTGSGVTMGTLDYMAPEQASDSHAVDGRVDVYGLGATLYKLLTGRAPFRGRKYKTTLRRLFALAKVAPPDLATLRPDVPSGLAAVVQKMIAKDPAARFGTPRDAAQALAPFAAGADLDSLAAAAPHEPRVPERSAIGLRPATVVGFSTTRNAAATAATAVKRRFPRRAALMLAAVAGLAALAAVILMVVLQDTANLTRHDKTKSKGDRKAIPPAAEQVKFKLLIPAYFYPAAEGLQEWDRLIAAASHVPLVAVANPASGPGETADPNYRQVIRRAVEAGGEVIGYVNTANGDRPTPEVTADIDRWLAMYPEIRGFFFDAQATSAEQMARYAEFYAYAKAKLPEGLIVANPGTTCDVGYFDRRTADVTCVFENKTGFDEFRRPVGLPASAAGRLAVLLYDVPDAARMQRYLKHAVEQGIKYVYVTDASGENPWSRLPSFWDVELRAIR